MAEITVDSRELDALVVQMKSAHKGVGRAASVIVRRTTLRCEAAAKVLVPVDTGFLKSSITSSFEGDGRFAEVTGTVTAGAHYAGYVEEGTSRMAPQPFMRPALAQVTPKFLADVAALGAQSAA